MDIIEKIDTQLGTLLDDLDIEYFYGWYDEDINNTHVTFTVISDEEDNFADDDAESINYLMQVDIWSKENMEDLKKEIKKCMKSIDNCTYNDGADLYEIDTKIYHKALRFYITEEVI